MDSYKGNRCAQIATENYAQDCAFLSDICRSKPNESMIPSKNQAILPTDGRMILKRVRDKGLIRLRIYYCFLAASECFIRTICWVGCLPVIWCGFPSWEYVRLCMEAHNSPFAVNKIVKLEDNPLRLAGRVCECCHSASQYLVGTVDSNSDMMLRNKVGKSNNSGIER